MQMLSEKAYPLVSDGLPLPLLSSSYVNFKTFKFFFSSFSFYSFILFFSFCIKCIFILLRFWRSFVYTFYARAHTWTLKAHKGIIFAQSIFTMNIFESQRKKKKQRKHWIEKKRRKSKIRLKQDEHNVPFYGRQFFSFYSFLISLVSFLFFRSCPHNIEILFLSLLLFCHRSIRLT